MDVHVDNRTPVLLLTAAHRHQNTCDVILMMCMPMLLLAALAEYARITLFASSKVQVCFLTLNKQLHKGDHDDG
jgi:hypothetical protein